MNAKRGRWWLVSILCSLVIGLLGRGSFGHVLLTLMVTIYLTLPVTVVTVGCYLSSFVIGRARDAARSCAIVAAVSALPLVSIVPGLALAASDVREAKAYCESMIPSLDAYRAEHGEFPADLTLVANHAAPPYLLRGQWSLTYTVFEGTFNFRFSHPNRFLKYFWYNSAERAWILAG